MALIRIVFTVLRHLVAITRPTKPGEQPSPAQWLRRVKLRSYVIIDPCDMAEHWAVTYQMAGEEAHGLNFVEFTTDPRTLHAAQLAAKKLCAS